MFLPCKALFLPFTKRVRSGNVPTNDINLPSCIAFHQCYYVERIAYHLRRECTQGLTALKYDK